MSSHPIITKASVHRRAGAPRGVVGKTLQERRSVPDFLLTLLALLVFFCLIQGSVWSAVYYLFNGDIFRAAIFMGVGFAIFVAVVWCPWIEW